MGPSAGVRRGKDLESLMPPRPPPPAGPAPRPARVRGQPRRPVRMRDQANLRAFPLPLRVGAFPSCPGALEAAFGDAFLLTPGSS